MNLRILTIAALAFVLLATGCQSKTKRFNLRGQVIEKNTAANEVTLKQDNIPGFMDAMTMPYRVKDPNAIQGLEPGDLITADVVTANHGDDYWLENVRIVDRSGRKSAEPSTSPRDSQ